MPIKITKQMTEILAQMLKEYEHGRKLAQIIIDDESNWEDLEEHLFENRPIEEHPLYYAHCAMGIDATREFQDKVEIIRDLNSQQ